MARSSLFNRDIAVDLGTANTLVYVRGKGIVIDEPSVVALNTRTGEVLAVGTEAKQMIGRTPGHIAAVRPLKDGVIADFDVTEKMLRYFISKARSHRLLGRPRVIVCVPSGITSVEQRAVEDATIAAGAKAAYIIEEPMAAAIGVGLPIAEPHGSCIVDIGGGTSEVAVISLGGIVASNSVRVGGDELDESIIAYVKRKYQLALGERSAEEIKKSLGAAGPAKPGETELVAQIRGRDLVTGMPKTVEVTQEEITEALSASVDRIVDAVRSTLDRTPPELAADIYEKGIVLAGGGGMLRGLAERLREEVGVPVHSPDDQLLAVVMGSGKCLEDFDKLSGVLSSSKGR